MPGTLLLPVRPRGDLPFRFQDGNGLPGRNVCELVYLPAGPVDLDCVGFSFRSHAEGQHQFALRKIAGPALHGEPLPVRSSAHADKGADTVAVGFCTHEFYAQAVIAAALVEVETRRAAVGHDEDV